MATRKATIIVLALLACGVRNSWEARAPPCDSDNCYLPECRCTSTSIPGNLKNASTPQIVMLTFDDAVSVLLHDTYYKTLLNEGDYPVKFKNPNGCNIGMTFFTSHEYCDYVLVHDLWTKGHEIASHSISHKSDQNYWKNGKKEMWEKELVGMRTILQHFAAIPEDPNTIVGVRVPFLQPGGNDQFQVMQENEFLWDCTLPTRTQVDPGIWPYSLDYRSKQQCQIGPCPTESFKGFWEVPMLDLFDKDDNPCAMLDTCNANFRNETMDLLMANFNRSYYGNRAPYGLFVHAAWFEKNKEAHWEGYRDFLTEVTKKKDVYFVTVSQALQWTRNPVPLSRIATWAPWKKQCNPKPNKCGKPQLCKTMKKEEWGGESERYMRICENINCPDVYPWVGNELGEED